MSERAKVIGPAAILGSNLHACKTVGMLRPNPHDATSASRRLIGPNTNSLAKSSDKNKSSFHRNEVEKRRDYAEASGPKTEYQSLYRECFSLAVPFLTVKTPASITAAAMAIWKLSFSSRTIHPRNNAMTGLM